VPQKRPRPRFRKAGQNSRINTSLRRASTVVNPVKTGSTPISKGQLTLRRQAELRMSQLEPQRTISLSALTGRVPPPGQSTRLRIASSAPMKSSLSAGTPSQRTNRPRGCGRIVRSSRSKSRSRRLTNQNGLTVAFRAARAAAWGNSRPADYVLARDPSVTALSRSVAAR
jgi:hypothetical protein